MSDPVRTDGCPAGTGRVTASEVDVCVDLYESPGFGALPDSLSFDAARDLCEQRGLRLCSEREWETACRGPQGFRYPYGDAYAAGACNTEAAAMRAAGTSNTCRSGFGAFDMSGNAAEWVASGALKGGDATGDAFATRCGARAFPADGGDPSRRSVRCCTDGDAAP